MSPSGDALDASSAAHLGAEDPDEVARNLFRWSARLVGIDGAVLRTTTDRDELTVIASFEPRNAELRVGARVARSGTGPAQEALRQRVTRVWRADDGPAPEGWAVSVHVPLIVGEQAIGVYSAGWDAPYRINPETLLVLEGAASLAASSIHRAGLLHGLKREEQRLRTLLDGLPLPALEFSIQSGTVTACNAAARSLFGDPTGSSLAGVVGEEAAAAARDATQPLGRATIPTIDRAPRVMAPHVARLSSGVGVLMLVDITQTVNLDERRRRFVRMVHHHLRTPLTPLLGYSQIVASQASGDPIVQEAVEEITEAVEDLVGHVNRLEQISRLAPVDPAEIRIVEVGDLIESGFDACLGDRAELIVEGDPSSTVACCPDNVIAALYEIFVNAYDHGRPPIRIQIGVVPDAVRLSVRDAGPGVPVEWGAGVFAPYASARDGYLAPPEGHLGLGLTLARGLMEATGGGLDHVDGAFTFTLPQPR